MFAWCLRDVTSGKFARTMASDSAPSLGGRPRFRFSEAASEMLAVSLTLASLPLAPRAALRLLVHDVAAPSERLARHAERLRDRYDRGERAPRLAQVDPQRFER